MLMRTYTPSGLAARLNDAKTKREAAVSKANQKFEAARAEVIATAHDHIDNIVQMREELEREQAALEATLADARASV